MPASVETVLIRRYKTLSLHSPDSSLLRQGIRQIITTVALFTLATTRSTTYFVSHRQIVAMVFHHFQTTVQPVLTSLRLARVFLVSTQRSQSWMKTCQVSRCRRPQQAGRIQARPITGARLLPR